MSRSMLIEVELERRLLLLKDLSLCCSAVGLPASQAALLGSLSGTLGHYTCGKDGGRSLLTLSASDWVESAMLQRLWGSSNLKG